MKLGAQVEFGWEGKPVAKLSGEVPSAHAVAVGKSGEVYVGQLSGVVQKFVRK